MTNSANGWPLTPITKQPTVSQDPPEGFGIKISVTTIYHHELISEYRADKTQEAVAQLPRRTHQALRLTWLSRRMDEYEKANPTPESQDKAT